MGSIRRNSSSDREGIPNSGSAQATKRRATQPRATQPRASQRRASQILAVVAVGAVLYLGRAAIIPVCLAVLFALVLSGPVEAFHRKGVPRNLSALVIVVLVIASLAGLAAWTWTPAQEWFSKAPQTMKVLKQKVNPVARALGRIDDLRNKADIFDASGRNASSAPAGAGGSESAPVMILDIGGSAMASLLTVVVVTAFLLAGGPPMMARMAAAFVGHWDLANAQRLIEQIRREVGHFYLVTAFINLGLGIATSLAMWACGMPTPYLWGALAAVLNFVPYVGAITTLGVISLVAIVSFDTLPHILAVMGSYVGLAMLEGQIVQPLLVGNRLDVNPLLVFLGLWFGGIFWGVPGILLATPALVALKVVAQSTERRQGLLLFLGRDSSLKEAAAREPRASAVAVVTQA